MRTMVALMVSCGALLPACVSQPLTPAGASVRFMKSDPPGACTEVGQIIGETPSGIQPNSNEEKFELSKNDARNKAAEKNANYVRWETSAEDGSRVSGTAFRCPPGT
jgi:uncharacterized protein DUF4156